MRAIELCVNKFQLHRVKVHFLDEVTSVSYHVIRLVQLHSLD